jgi:hypothetical protein
MRAFFVPCFWMAILTIAASQPPSPSNPATPTLREAALDNLLSERTSLKALDTAIADARRNGVNEQAILEARFLFHVDRSEDDAIAALAPEFTARRDSFKTTETAIFGEKEDWLAVVEYVQAIAALRNGDKNAFKQHITEAFWLSPGQASAFAPHIERMRLDEAMKAVKVNFDASFPLLQNLEPLVLKSLMDGKKALLLHFWSPLSQECEAAMPDFAATATALAGKDIAVVSLVPENDPKQVTEARKMITPYANKPSGTWIIDSSENPLGRMMRVKNLPTMVLLSAEGTVLFNGHPTDEKFWESMIQVDDKVERPKSEIESGE